MAKVASPTTNLFELLLNEDKVTNSSTSSAAVSQKTGAANKKSTGGAAGNLNKKNNSSNVPSSINADLAAAAPSLTPAARAAARANKPKPVKKAKVVQGQDADGFQTRGNKRSKETKEVSKESVDQKKGRTFDRQSGGKVTRKPPAKKGGAGKGNWGKTPETPVEAALEVAEVVAEAAAEEAQTPSTEEAGVTATSATEEVDNTLDYDEYLRRRKEEENALLAKLGQPQPKSSDNADSTQSAAAVAKNVTPASRKGTKALDLSEILTVKPAPTGADRRGRDNSKPRGNGRGGRGGGGGARGGAGKGPKEGGKPTGGAARGGKGGKRGGGRLDTSNMRQFPTLG